MKMFPESFTRNYADWSAVGWAMVLGHAPASPDKHPKAKSAQTAAVRGWEDEGGSLKAPKKAAPAKKRPAKKAKARRR